MRNPNEVSVWDPLVRVFHWSLVGAFTLAFVTEGEWMPVHAYAGYTVVGLVLFRVLWGFIGTRHARFRDFVRSPRTVVAYLRSVARLRPRRYLGHNPAGGAMILLLLASLVLTGLSGMATYGAAEGLGPLAAWTGALGEAGAEALEEIHEFLANFTLLLVLIHVAGVLIESLLHRESLVRAMFTGRKPLRDGK